MNTKKISAKTAMLALAMVFGLAGCASVNSAYQSTVDTVSGWFKSDDKDEKSK